MTVQIQEIVELVLFVAPDYNLPISSTTKLRDVVADSIDYVELAMEIQGRYDIPVDLLPNCEDADVGDIVSYINSTPQIAKASLGRFASTKKFYSVPRRSENDDKDFPVV